MTTVSDPAPLFDLVTGFPPDDAVDVTVPMPLSLAIYMTVLESTGHAAELAVIRRIHVEQARDTVRRIQTGAGELTTTELPESARLRITHIVEDRVRGVRGLRPHMHVFVGRTFRCADGTGGPVDLDGLGRWADDVLFPFHRDRLVAETTQRCGLVWGPTGWSSHEVVEPSWLVERTSGQRDDDLTCPGPWPRQQVRP